MNNVVRIHTPAAVVMPRGADWAAAVFAAAAEGLRALWRAKADAQGAAARRAQEASELRRFAAGLSASHPSFAADLYAAADRHFEAR